MKNMLVLVLVSTYTSISAFAMVAPYYFKGNEIKAILDNSEIATKLKMAGITSITSLNQNTAYRIVAGSCAVNVQISYLPNRIVGQPGSPLKMFLSASDAVCTQK